MTKKQLLDWVNKMGGREKAAEFLGVNPATVWRWVAKPSRMTRITIMAIESNIKEQSNE